MGPDSPKVIPNGPSKLNWLNKCYNCSYLDHFKKSGSSKLNNLSFDQNHLIKNPILFGKYLTPKKITQKRFSNQNLCIDLSFQEKKTI